jgi:EAL and modified HD-GYP domain-containing signal transduction protein
MRGYYIHKEPVLDNKRSTFGNELSFRKVGTHRPGPEWPTVRVDRDVIDAMSYGGGLERLSGNNQALLDIDTDVMQINVLEFLPKKTVLQVSERGGLDKDVLLKSAMLKKQAYQIAIDYTASGRGLLPFHEVADFVRIDASSAHNDQLASTVALFGGLPLQLIATNVPDQEAFEKCQKLGFSLFQGPFFMLPSTEPSAPISHSQAVLMQLSRDLRANREIAVIEKAFRNSPKLTHGLLRLINSAFLGVHEKVVSIKHAIALLGYDNLQKWVVLLLFTVDGKNSRPNPLIEKAVMRGMVMELLAEESGEKAIAESAFITGMLSLFNVLFDVGADELATKMNLTEEIQDALLAREGFLGALLTLTEKMDRQEYDRMEEHLASLSLSTEDVLCAETDALIDCRASVFSQ